MKGLDFYQWSSDNLRENTSTWSIHTQTYTHRENKFSVVTSFRAVTVKSDYWQFKVIRKPRNKNKFGA